MISLYNVIGIIWRRKKFNFMLEIGILRKILTKIVGVLGGAF